MEAGDDVVSRLSTLGLAPGDISHVAHSHLHYDHCGGVTSFPEATSYIQRRELGFAFYPPPYQRDIYVPWTFDRDGGFDVLEGSYDVFGDGKVVLFPTPGHTPGHQSLLVKLDQRAVILCADAAYDLTKMRERALPAVTWSADHMLSSWELIEQLERAYDAELIITHEVDWKSKLRVGPDEWYE